MHIYKTEYNSQLGKIIICSDENSLLGIWFENQKHFGTEFVEKLIKNNDIKILKDTVKWLDDYFAGKQPSINDIKLNPQGSDFRQMVWSELCKIPYGETVTYGELAKVIAKKMGVEKMSAQAVGGAVGHNPISLIIPCHRVVGQKGNLTGYAGGLEVKTKLLQLENAI